LEGRVVRRDNVLTHRPGGPAGGYPRKTLREFVRAGLADAGYHSVALSRAVPTCSIIRVTSLDTGKSQLQGLVRVWLAKAAMAAIDTLDGRLPLTELVRDGTFRSRQREDTRNGDLKIELVDD
jgi:hypothetical protein